MMLVKRRNLLLCMIQKTGSTFWLRILQGLGRDSKPFRVTSITHEEAYNTNDGYETLQAHHPDLVSILAERAISFMFVRNPYTRLFSAWLDKIYNLNLVFFKHFGRKIAANRAKHIKYETLGCAPDITFGEFVSYLTSSMLAGKCVDAHFSLQNDHCHPCKYHYSYIGKYETFKEDTEYILEKSNLTQFVIVDDFDSGNDEIKDAVHFLYSQKSSLKNCNVSIYCAMFKVWHRLQSRGIVSTKLKFPLANAQVAQQTHSTTFRQMILEARSHSDPGELKRNRKRAYVREIRSLTKDQIDGIKHAFNIDFQLFGYDFEPLSPDLVAMQTDDYDFSPQCPIQ